MSGSINWATAGTGTSANWGHFSFSTVPAPPAWAGYACRECGAVLGVTRSSNELVKHVDQHVASRLQRSPVLPHLLRGGRR